MGWPGAVQGFAGGAAAGAAAGAPFGPIGVGIAGGTGALLGAYQGYQGGGKGSAKFNAKRSKKSMKAAARQETRSAKNLYREVHPYALKANKAAARQQMKIDKEWIRKQQPIHKKALEQKRKYQNKTAKKQIPINAKLHAKESELAHAQNLQNQQYANMERIHNRPMREEAAKENRHLFEKYGQPHKYENEKFYKKSTLTAEQQRNLAFQNKQGMAQKGYRDIAKNPLFRQASGIIGENLNNSSAAYERYKAPLMQEFQEEILPAAFGRAGRSGNQGGHIAQAGLHAAGKFATQIGAVRQALQERMLDKTLQYAGASTASRQQEIQNAQHNAQLGLGTKGFERFYKPSLYSTPQGGTFAGGGQFNGAAAVPSFAGVGQAQFGPLNVPSINLGGGGQNYGQFFQQQQGNGGGFPGLNQFLGGAGQGLGTAFANLASQGAAKYFQPGNQSTGLPPQQNWGGGQGGFTGGGNVS